MLTQTEKIEEFLQQDGEFQTFRERLRPLYQDNPNNPSHFLSNQFVLTHFKFSFFILDKIWTLVVQMQHQYTILPVIWTKIDRLKNEFVNCLREVQDRRFVRFPIFQNMDELQIATFENVLKRLILNMQVRFPCPSTGVDSRLARSHMDTRIGTLNETVLKSYMRRCPLFINVGIMLFPEDLIRRRSINTFFLSGHFPEIQQIAEEIIRKEALIIQRVNTSSHHNEDVDGRNTVITLLDVFKIISPNNYPFLWDVTLKTTTVMPTSVNCEQSFSRLRNKMHENMKQETSFHFMEITHKNPINFFRE